MAALYGQDQELLGLIGRGDLRRVGDALIKHYAGEVFGLCHAMVHDRATAEDLTQDTFGKAFAGLTDFRGESSFRTWILRIARNRCIDHLRARGREPWSPIDDEGGMDLVDQGPLPSELLARREEVERALEELSEGERALVVLRFGKGLSYSDLSLAFGIKEGAVRMRISRALSRMRAALDRGERREAKGTREFSAGALPLSPSQPSASCRLRRSRKRQPPLRQSRKNPLVAWFRHNLPHLSARAMRKLRKKARGL